MSSNVLPTAPAYEQTETQTTLYPNLLTTQPDNNFRMQKANEVLKYLRANVTNGQTKDGKCRKMDFAYILTIRRSL